MAETPKNIIEADTTEQFEAMENFMEKCNRNAGLGGEGMISQRIVDTVPHTQTKRRTAKITAATRARPVRITTDGNHGLNDNDRVVISRVRGMKELNGNAYIVRNKTDTAFDLQSVAAAAENVDSTQFDTYTSGGRARKVGTPVMIETATQANPVVVTTFDNHGLANGETVLIEGVRGMRQINRQYKVASKTDKTFALQTLGSSPANVDGTGFGAYTSGGSVRKVFSTATISGVTKATPAVVATAADHGLANGEIVRISGVEGMDELNGEYYTVAGKTARNFQLKTVAVTQVNVDGRNFRTYRSRGHVTRPRGKKNIAGITTTGNKVTVTTAVNHGFNDGDSVLIRGVGGMTGLNGKHYTVSEKTDTAFVLKDVQTSAVSGTHTANSGTVRLRFVHWAYSDYLTDPNYATTAGAAKNTRLLRRLARSTMRKKRRVHQKSIALVAGKYSPSPEEIMGTSAAPKKAAPAPGGGS